MYKQEINEGTKYHYQSNLIGLGFPSETTTTPSQRFIVQSYTELHSSKPTFILFTFFIVHHSHEYSREIIQYKLIQSIG